MTTIVMIIVLLIVAGMGGIFWREVCKRKINIWLPGYLAREIRRLMQPEASGRGEPVHILFCFVDHFEPGWNGANLATQRMRVDDWVKRYPGFAEKFQDADGFHPRHTWFYPPHYYQEEHILKLLSLCVRGFGEIEMHLHHSRMVPFPDTSETLKRKIEECIDVYSRHGIFRTQTDGIPGNRYAFVHGDWALDNSREEYCGVNDEITILKETGCYADFTFPSYMMESQPRMVNTIYYADDDPRRPKSYDKGKEIAVGSRERGDLMFIQGPLGFRWKKRKGIPIPGVDDGEISANNPPSKDRVDGWVNTGIHVRGREEWVVIKVFTHGAAIEQHGTLLGDPINEMHAYLNRKYNDGTHYALHYVTARELYNIVVAARDGKSGNPGLFRNYMIDEYRYNQDREMDTPKPMEM